MKKSGVLTGAAIVSMVWLILLVPACASAPPTPSGTPTSGGTAESSPSSQERSGAAAGISTSVAARTPIPTPTRNAIERRVDTIAGGLGLGDEPIMMQFRLDNEAITEVAAPGEASTLAQGPFFSDSIE